MEILTKEQKDDEELGMLDMIAKASRTFDENIEGCKKYIHPEKHELFKQRCEAIRNNKDYDNNNSFVIPYRALKIMEKLSSDKLEEVTSWIEELKWPPKRTKLRTMRMVMEFAQKGPELFKLLYQDEMLGNDIQIANEMIEINKLLSEGKTLDEATREIIPVRQVEIKENDSTLFKGIVIWERPKKFKGLNVDTGEQFLIGEATKKGQLNFHVYGKLEASYTACIDKDGVYGFRQDGENTQEVSISSSPVFGSNPNTVRRVIKTINKKMKTIKEKRKERE